MRLVNVSFRTNVDRKPLGSVTLGFLDATLVLSDAEITVKDMCVRLTVEGQPSVSFPRRSWTTEDGRTGSNAIVKLDENTYGALVRCAFALPSVQRAVEIARRKVA
jgi:hypothetical protein